MREEVMDQIKEEMKDKQPEWDISTQAGDDRKKYDMEDMLASRMAK